MIQIDSVTFTYEGGERASLQNCSLNVGRGEFVLVCGRSGCGKTTLTKLVNGLIPSQVCGKLSGHVSIRGKDVSGEPAWQRAQNVGSVFQNPKTQFFNLDTVSELVFGLENKGVPREAIAQRLREVVSEFELDALMGKSVFELSGGEKQKIAIAAAYAENPEIYVLDEPSANLDRTEILRLRQLLQKLKRQGKTILVAEHRTWYLAELIDRAVFMEDGTVKEEWPGARFAALTAEQCERRGLRSVRPVEERSHASDDVPETGFAVMDLTVKRGRRILWEHLSFCAPRGKVVAVCGKNGAGKTTLAQVLCGLRKEGAGTVSLDGKKLSRRRRRESSFLILQDVNRQLFADSVLSEATLGSDASESEAEAVLDALQLKEFGQRHPMALSGGQKQRLAVADGCLSRKEVILFDEPTSGLDFDNMQRVGGLIRSLLKQNKSVIVITHDMEFIHYLGAAVVRPASPPER